MSSAAVDVYRRLIRELWLARALALAGDLPEDEEADRAEELDQHWEEMTAEERAAMEVELRQGGLKPGAAAAPTELPPRRGA